MQLMGTNSSKTTSPFFKSLMNYEWEFYNKIRENIPFSSFGFTLWLLFWFWANKAFGVFHLAKPSSEPGLNGFWVLLNSTTKMVNPAAFVQSINAPEASLMTMWVGFKEWLCVLSVFDCWENIRPNCGVKHWFYAIQ